MNTSLIPLFNYFSQIHPLSLDSEIALRERCLLKEFNKNEEIQAVGATCRTIYFVVSGLARIYYPKDGNEVTEYFAFENDLIIRAESLFTEQPSKKAIQALEDSVLVGIPAQPLFQLFDSYPDLERLFRKLVQIAYVDTLKRMEGIQFLTAEERYTKLIKDRPDLVLKIPLKHIASYLGITQVSLSRIRSQLR
jgi:CRP-like cAMP-binding protein